MADDLPTVLLLGPPSVFKSYEKQFSEKFHFLKPWESSIPFHQFLSAHAGSVKAAFCYTSSPITSDILQNLLELRFITTSSAGVDHIDLRACKQHGVKVANAGSIFSEDVADTAVGLLIDVLRRISAANRFIKAVLWNQKCDYPLGHKLGGKPVGIIGMRSIGLGVDHIDLRACKQHGVKVANAGSIFSEDVADTAVGLLIDVLRRISAANRFIKAVLWNQKCDYPLGHKLGGKPVGIIGMRSIGLEVAKRLNAFGCIILYTSRNEKPHVKFPFCLHIQELAAKCEILIICCALTDQTRHKSVMLALGRNGIIVNIAREAIVNEKDLVECLLKREIAGVGLDVFENEPDVPEELFELDNVVMTPHHAVMTEESMRSLYELVVGNLDAFFSNKPVMFEVI